MKKTPLLLAVLIAIISLISCKGAENNTHTPDGTTQTIEAPTDDIPSTANSVAMEAYRAVLENDLAVYVTNTKETSLLSNCTTPYEGIYLYECEKLQYAYIDFDRDAVNELVIDCGDTLILRYYKGTVYLYSFIFRHFYHLQTDGTYAWNDTNKNMEYGESRLCFDGTVLHSIELWRIVNDGEPNADYFIGGKKATKEEINGYFEKHPKTYVTFTPLEIGWQNKISLHRAIEIASEYWNIKNGDIDPDTGFPFALLPKTGTNGYYCIALSWLVENSHYSTIETIEIDCSTGEIVAPSPSYTVSLEEALEIASNHWNVQTLKEDFAAGIICIYRIVVLSAPPESATPCYHIALQQELYSRDSYEHYDSSIPFHIYTNSKLCINAHTGECQELPPDMK